MNLETQRALGAVNRAFYASHAGEFSATRDHPWPGWTRVLARAQSLTPTDADGPENEDGNAERAEAPPLRVLDLGCGNGRFARCAAECFALDYHGVDASAELLEIARRSLRVASAFPVRDARLSEIDLLADGAHRALPRGPFELIALFGLLHHVPAFERRCALLRALASRLEPHGLLAVSAWRFGERARFAQRVLPWSDYNAAADSPVDERELEAGDTLLRWGEADGASAQALRYCHASPDAELAELVEASGLVAVDDFLADGREGDLNRYLVLQPRQRGG